MRKTKRCLGGALLFFACMMLYPVSQGLHAIFAEDSFAPFWEQSVQQIH